MFSDGRQGENIVLLLLKWSGLCGGKIHRDMRAMPHQPDSHRSLLKTADRTGKNKQSPLMADSIPVMF